MLALAWAACSRLGGEAPAPLMGKGGTQRFDAQRSPVLGLLRKAEETWNVCFVGCDLKDLMCSVPAGEYTLEQLLDRVCGQAGLSWNSSSPHTITLLTEVTRRAAARAIERRPQWVHRQRLALTAAQLVDSMPRELRESLRDGHRVGTWRLPEETLRWLSPLLLGHETSLENPSVAAVRRWISRHEHTELQVRLQPQILLWHGGAGVDQITALSSYPLLRLQTWAQAVTPRFQPAPEDLPPQGRE